MSDLLLGRATLVDRVLATATNGRVVTLLGAGGIGKTSVARAWHQRRGATWISLVDVTDAAGLYMRVATTLGIRLPRAVEDQAAHLGQQLQQRATAVVLDNAEHVLDAVRQLVSIWLEPGFVPPLLITSRVALGLPSEVRIPVTPLAPAHARETFLSYADPDVVDIDDPVIDEIVGHVGGSPLALRLAASRTSLSTPTQILQALRSGQPLRGLAAGVPERHANLHDVVATSWALLDEPSRSALSALCLFRAPFELPHAEAIAVQAEQVLTLQRASLLERTVNEASLRLAAWPEVRAWVLDRAAPEPWRWARYAQHLVDRADALRRRRYEAQAGDAWRQVVALEPELASILEGASDMELAGRALVQLHHIHSGMSVAHGERLMLAHEALVNQLDWPLRAKLIADRCRQLVQLGRGQEALSRVQQARAACVGQTRDAVARLAVAEGEVRMRVSDRTAALEVIAEGAGLAQAAERPRLWAYCQWLRADGLRGAGSSEESLEIAHLALAEPETSLFVRGALHLTIALADPGAQALTQFAHAERIQRGLQSEAFDRMIWQAKVVGFLDAPGLGMQEEGLAALDLARQAAERNGDKHLVLAMDARELWHCVASAPSGTVERLQHHLKQVRRLSHPFVEVASLCALGAAHHLAGDPRAARVEYARCTERCEQLGAAKLAGLSVLDGVACAAAGGTPEPLDHDVADAIVGVYARGQTQPLRAAIQQHPPAIVWELWLHALANQVLEDSQWTIEASGAWFTAPRQPSVSLGRRAAPRRLLAALLRSRLTDPGAVVDVPRCVELGWPGERVQAQAGTNRVYTAMRTLRSLGLGAALQTVEGGYRLDPKVLFIVG